MISFSGVLNHQHENVEMPSYDSLVQTASLAKKQQMTRTNKRKGIDKVLYVGILMAWVGFSICKKCTGRPSQQSFAELHGRRKVTMMATGPTVGESERTEGAAKRHKALNISTDK